MEKNYKQGIELEPGVTRDLVAATEEYTIVRMHMKKGVADPTHFHPHAQAEYVVSGWTGLFWNFSFPAGTILLRHILKNRFYRRCTEGLAAVQRFLWARL